MAESENVSKRRMGPIGFHSEAKVTSLRDAPASNEGGMGEASGPFLETPRGSKELNVAGPLVLGISGFLIFLAGLIFNLFIAAIGLGMVVCAILTNRRNRTQLRLRTRFKNS